jgi:mediator of RNA polymerase II transcription subunit 5
MRDKVPPTDLFWSPAVIYAVEKLTTENATAFTAWFKALFDSSSEGIEDTILR